MTLAYVLGALAVLVCALLVPSARFLLIRLGWAAKTLPKHPADRERTLADRAALCFRYARPDVARAVLLDHPLGANVYRALERAREPAGPIPDADPPELERARAHLAALVRGEGNGHAPPEAS